MKALAQIAATLLLALSLLWLWSPPAQAQQDASEAGGMLVSFLENTLSGDNRKIRVEGLEGAFSSKATIARLTVSDDDGVWLTLEGVTLDWNRLSLVRGAFSVNLLKAARIEITRAPKPTPADPKLPTPEATAFALPDLPVSIDITEISADEIILGDALFGQSATLSLQGNVRLDGGVLDTKLRIARLDRAGDALGLEVAYSDADEALRLNLTLTEAADGLLSSVLDLPGRPELEFTVAGEGPLADFNAALDFSTDGQQRLGGSATLQGLGDVAAGKAQGLSFAADLAGDIDPLLPAAYRSFFGPDIRATLRGETRPGQSENGGGVRIDSLALRTQALGVTGALSMAGGALDTANLKATITPPSGQTTVILPVSGAQTTVAAMALRLQKPRGANWTITGEMTDLHGKDFQLDQAHLQAKGQLDQAAGFALEGDVSAALTGLQLTDPALAAATGPDLHLRAHLTTAGTSAFQIDALSVQGEDYTAKGDIRFEGSGSDLHIATQMTIDAQDLGRLSALAGHDLSGAVMATLAGQITPLSGAFHVDLQAKGRDLSANIAQLDPLLAGETKLALIAIRDANGLRVDTLDLRNPALFARANGDLSSQSGQISFDAELAHVEQLLPQAKGPLRLSAQVTREGDSFDGLINVTGPSGLRATLDGSATQAGAATFTVDLAVTSPEDFAPQLAGAPLEAKGQLVRDAGSWSGTGMLKATGKTHLQLEGQFAEQSGAADLSFDGLIGRLQHFIPGLDGALTAVGKANRTAGVWSFSTSADGPLGIQSRIAGNWDEITSVADVTAKGSLRLEGANAFLKPNLLKGLASFDLALKGPAHLQSVRGTITTTDAQFVLPQAGQTIDNIASRITLADGTAQVTLRARPRDGGQVSASGPVTLMAPYRADLQISLRDVVVTDNLSYKTQLGGQLRLDGSLTQSSRLSGRIDVGETNFNLNTAGGAISAAPIPPIRHIGQTPAQITTRVNAGLVQTAASTTSRDSKIALDVLINAPKQIFARGRGLNAELGGAITLRGSTSDLSPSGQISLIRGTFDILGRRLTLDEGRVSLLGNLKPYLEFRSTANTEQGSATLEISGPVDAPQIQVTSSPSRPSEETLALLLFGENIQDISPLALARLANSVLTLSGRGGKTSEKLRRKTGASSVDVGANALGVGQLGIGGYLSDNVYTDFNITAEGDSELSVNLDVTKSLTITGSADSAGTTGLGLFFKRDY